MDWEEERQRAVIFLRLQLESDEEVHAVVRKAFTEEGFGLMILKQAVQCVFNLESQDAARLVAKATFESKRGPQS